MKLNLLKMHGNSMVEKIRIDKWLHAVRLYKSRTNATDACDGGKVKVNGSAVKPSRLIALGEAIVLRKRSSTFTYVVVKIIEKRVSAVIAKNCYNDLTPEAEKLKIDLPSAFIDFGARDRGEGRPTKKDRREIDDLKKSREDWWENWEDD
jgi:ribosome-associated heat shock protein Hsp15